MFYSFFQRSNALAKSSTAPGQYALRRENVNLKIIQVELTIQQNDTEHSGTLAIVIPARLSLCLYLWGHFLSPGC